MTKKQIRTNFKYRLQGSNFMKKIVIDTLWLLPENVAEIISKKCWFISSFEDGWAFVLRGSDIKNDEYVIFLSDELLKESETQIKYTVAHEIGHVILGHQNSIGVIQDKKEIQKQEREAHMFVKKYLP